MSLVLVVEDDTDCRNSMADLLELEGHSVIGAGNGRQALDVLLQGRRPSLILLDLLMPVMGGVEFLGALDQYPSLRDIPICILSASSTEEFPPSVRQLAKPISADRLLDMVDHCPPEKKDVPLA